jgi:heme o synthase
MPAVLAPSLRDCLALLKPRVMSLVVFTGWVGLMLAPGDLHPLLAFTAILAIAMSAGGAGAINMWYDRDIDMIMTRTQSRPIPAGRVEPVLALELGAVLIFTSTILMGLATNWLAAFILCFAAFFYVAIYTMWLKRRTPQNIVIGGAAGAFPPMIGWVAVTGTLDIMPCLLFMLIFIWTPPHFWALALYRSDDYRRAGVPMLPVTAGLLSTKRHIVVYSILLAALSFVPLFIFPFGMIYGVAATLLSLYFVFSAFRILFEKEGYRAARHLFFYSIFYLAALMGAMVLDRSIPL